MHSEPTRPLSSSLVIVDCCRLSSSLVIARYREARAAAESNAEAMATIARLGDSSKLGQGSHTFRVKNSSSSLFYFLLVYAQL